MGSRIDGGPADLDELLEHYRLMAKVHHDQAGFARAATREDRARDHAAMATAYTGAAHELEIVLEEVRSKQTGT